MRFRCFVYAVNPDKFVGECIDLDIAVEEASFSHALRSLKDAIEGYLSVALEGDVRGLVPRPSPLSHRLLYNYRALVYRLLARKRGAPPRKWKQFEVGRPSPC
jgi:hypothetical protein